MPRYTFRNKDTEEEFDAVISMSAYDSYLEENPHLERVWTAKAPALISGVTAKPSEGFRDLLKGIHKGAGRQSNINVY